MKSVMVMCVDCEDIELQELLKSKYETYIHKIKQNKKETHVDSGFDLFVPTEIVLGEDESMKDIDHCVKIACYSYPELEPVPFYLFPRSSMSKTPFRMANSVGIIDMGYRGVIKSSVDVKKCGNNNYSLPAFSRLFQVCSFNLMPFEHIYLVDKNDVRFAAESTLRGRGGFGSTGR